MGQSFTIAPKSDTIAKSERATLLEELKALQAMERILLQSKQRIQIRLREIESATVERERMEMTA